MTLPHYLKKYFWDTDFERLDLSRSKVYILKRILEYGDEEALAWMWKHFQEGEIRRVLVDCRGLSRKSASYWAHLLGVAREEVPCLKKHSSDAPETHWPY